MNEHNMLNTIKSIIMSKRSKINVIKRLLLVPVLALFAYSISSGYYSDVSSPNQDSTSLDLYLLIGQSNMAGRSTIRSSEKDTLENVYLFTGKDWEPAANPLNKYSTVRKDLSMQKLSPGYSFAKELSVCSDRKIGLIANARGGTSIVWWQKGYTGPNDFDLYEEAVIQVRKAQRYGCLRGIIWHQGEQDRYRLPQEYMSLLKELVKDLREELGARVFFVGGEIGRWKESSAAINKVIRSIPKEIRNAGYVSADGLFPLNEDSTNPHFNTRSQLALGKRYADEVLEKVYHVKPCIH